jgi:hypothetical protein
VDCVRRLPAAGAVMDDFFHGQLELGKMVFGGGGHGIGGPSLIPGFCPMRRYLPSLASRFAARSLMTAVMSVLGAVAFLFLGGGGAEASCGDWLAGHPRSAEAPQAIRADREAGGPVAPRPDNAPRLPQCDGPACRGVPFIPVLPRDVSADAPRPDPADGVALASLCHRDVGRRFSVSDDRKPVAVIVLVPIRPPRRASLQA